MKRVILPLILLLLLSSALSGLDYTVGKYHLRILENSGHFSLSYNNNKQVVPLFYSDNPRSSSLYLSYNDTVIRLGEEKNIAVSVQETMDSIIVQYDLEKLSFEQIFSFLQEGDDVLGVQITYRISNYSGTSVNTRIRSIIDTTLGETQPAHFSTPQMAEVSREYRFSPDSSESYILSGNNTNTLAVYFIGESASKPAEVLAANWKRLTESSGEYDVQANRNFNYLPFSINDSALALFFGPERIFSEQSAEYTIICSYLPDDADPLFRQEKFKETSRYVLNRENNQTVLVSQSTGQGNSTYSTSQ